MLNSDRMSFLRITQFAGVLILLPLSCSFAAASWVTVHSGISEAVAIDRDSIAGNGSTVSAWSRVKLDREVVAVGGNYDTIRAENLYDCGLRRFTTLRRAYYRGEQLVREEGVTRQRANPIQAGSLDERLMNIACQARWEAGSVSGNATGREPPSPSGDADRPVAMHADLRKSGDVEVARTFPVADPTGGDRPKLIQLPAIDKAALAQAAAAQEAALHGGQEATSKGQTAKASSTAGGKASSTTAAKADAVVASAHKETGALSEKRVRELHYANSGPPRVSRKRGANTLVAHAEGENPAASMHKHWSYEGDTGPAHWAKLRPDYSACGAGKRQSPIDIRDGVRVNLEKIRFDYKAMQFRIVDNGHTVQVNLGEGSSIHVLGKRYALQQFHFHRPAEERVNGKSFDMSAHLVHRSDDGQLAVVAVLLEKGAEHPLIQTLLNNLPLEQNIELSPEEVIDPSELLPENRAYWTYMGSLTTPPCTEGVLWMVLKQPLQVASEQAAIFSRVFRSNSRPIQSANGRLIKETR